MEATTPVELQSDAPRYGRAMLWGVVAAMAVGGVWFLLVMVSGSWIGAPGVALGAAVGYAVLLGSGRHRGAWAQGLAVVIALVGMLAIAALGMRIVTTRQAEELARHGIDHLPLLPHWRMYWNLTVASFVADVTTVVFFGVGLWVAINAPRRFETFG